MKKGTNTFGKLVHSVGRLMKKKKKKKKSGVFITLIIPPRLFSSSIMVDDRSREHISVIDSALDVFVFLPLSIVPCFLGREIIIAPQF